MSIFRLFLTALALLLLSPFVWFAWSMYGAPWYYQVTFGPRAFEQVLADIELPDIRISRILKYEGGPKVWMDTEEYVSAAVEYMPHITLTTTLPPLNGKNIVRAKGLWIRTDAPDPIAQQAIDAIVKCRNTLEQHGNIMDDEDLKRPDTPGLLYSISAASLDSMAIIRGVVYDPSARMITYVHCDY